MSSSRAESQHSHFGRRRSNTAQSVLRSLPPPAPNPLKVGDSRTFNLWVHESKDAPGVLFNYASWPGVVEGDLLRVNKLGAENPDESFLFFVPKEDQCPRPQLQISVPKPISDAFSLRNNGEVSVTKVDREVCSASYVEFVFQDQYLGRNDMWRLEEQLVGQCVHTNQEVAFVGAIVAKIQNIYIKGRKVPSAIVTPSTRPIFRSLSAKVTIFIQVCRELWEFAGDGERYNEKIVHSFLPALFAKWREATTNHTVTIVLISRVFYEECEMRGPVRDGARSDERGNWYKDFYKVITDHEVLREWKATLVSLKDSFWDFQREILLTHHYRAAQDVKADVRPRLVGRLSYAHDGPILEAINLGLNPTETHYIDRSLSVTGATTLLISPGTGYFRVNKKLLRLTTARMLDQGSVLDLILLTKPPLHQSPIFSFQGTEPETRFEIESKSADPLASDPLWGGDDGNHPNREDLKNFWWEPFWISTSFWDKQMDLPFRHDRFIARAKMHEIQMLGLLEADVLSSIEVPYLPDKPPAAATRNMDTEDQFSLNKSEADKFDMDIFSLRTNYIVPPSNKPTSNPSSRLADKRSRALTTSSKITTIEESPRRIIKELPDEVSTGNLVTPVTAAGLSSSPSQASIHSVRSTLSKLSNVSATNQSMKPSLAAKLTPSWLFNPFRSGPSEPQTTQVFASGSPSTTPIVTAPTATRVSIPPKPAPAIIPETSVQPVAIKASTAKTVLSRTFEEETVIPHRGSLRRSPMNTPPRDDTVINKRRSAASTLAQSYTSSPRSWSNPLQPEISVSYGQESLARRWEHLLPETTHKHDIKWKALVTPSCLPLTMEYLPSNAELESCYDNYYYDFVVDPKEMRSFLVKPPQVKGTPEEVRRAWALVVMRGMAAVRIAQGFQFISRPSTWRSSQKAQVKANEEKMGLRKSKFLANDDAIPRATGPADVLQSPLDPVYLSMMNEIHKISYTGDSIQVRRYVRRLLPIRVVEYECFIWPKLGGGYTSHETSFSSYGLENYGWNRLDMLVAGYERNFNESLRYWRTRFIVVPTKDPPMMNTGPGGERLNDEEIRILGIEKLAEQFTKLRWQPADERINYPAPPVRFLPTTLDPAASVLDEALMGQLDQIHEQGPLKKKIKSEKEISDMPLTTIVKAMREEDGVSIKHHQWHRSQYPNSFTGSDFVSWLVKEFNDVSSRAQAVEWGVKLMEQGLFEHCRGLHGFLDGHYYYRFKGEYSVPMTPKGGWFRRYTSEETTPKASGNLSRHRSISNRKPQRKRLILSQTMVIEIDPNKKSDQAEAVVLHHDIIHNPATVFHFELQWIAMTARCIEDQLKGWNRTIERYGLKLIEAYVTQISDISSRNAFQSCFPIRLAAPPPEVPNLEARVPEYTQTSKYFEYALLRKFDFIVDVEAAELYPEQVEVVYSYRRLPYKYSQFVHRSGAAFVQVIGGSDGFLFLTNRLMGRLSPKIKNKKEPKPLDVAGDIRDQLNCFCSDVEALNAFYEEQLALLTVVPEDPPPLSI
ncbi:hypothetical protein P691DRAFT_776015 [Macrolepiota fuliginosa MF-IS2]|uniref:Vacuolar membrane-associated protein IML1 n=1 Tax=Macrolepiota fuliginosa MF-IS2 TaxID=1400762 RepID=A0A9P5XCK4_9AGAR|nr:hypothetical protein P691DRAFT_776015 [Macrolepiota fuliginosa MF-IS2]